MHLKFWNEKVACSCSVIVIYSGTENLMHEKIRGYFSSSTLVISGNLILFYTIYKENLSAIYYIWSNMIHFGTKCSRRKFTRPPNTFGFNVWAHCISTVSFLKCSISLVQTWLIEFPKCIHSNCIPIIFWPFFSVWGIFVQMVPQERFMVSTKSIRVHPLKTMNTHSQSGRYFWNLFLLQSVAGQKKHVFVTI